MRAHLTTKHGTDFRTGTLENVLYEIVAYINEHWDEDEEMTAEKLKVELLRKDGYNPWNSSVSYSSDSNWDNYVELFMTSKQAGKYLK